MSLRAFLLSFLLTGCAAPALTAPPPTSRQDGTGIPMAFQDPYPSSRSGLDWRQGEPLMQGFLGASMLEEVTVEGDGVEIEVDDTELPLIGGGGQWKLGGKNADFGVEGLLSFSGRANTEAFVIGGGGAAVAIDVDLLVFELFGGPFASVGEKVRFYGGAGPLLQFADYDQSGSGLDDDGSGFGAGWYARTGVEFLLPARSLLGIGARWSDSSVDLGGGLGDLEVEGLQAVVTLSRGL